LSEQAQPNTTRQRTRVPPWQKAFLAVLAEGGNVTLAARAAGIERSTAYDRRNSNEAFAALWDDAMDQAGDLLEAEARRRAYEGWDEPVFGRLAGKDAGEGEIGVVRKYSDTLMQTLLKGAKPEKYRERHEIDHKGKVEVEYVNDWRAPD
jgi:hypothetical protein